MGFTPADDILVYSSLRPGDLAIPLAATRAGAVGIVEGASTCAVEQLALAAAAVAECRRKWGMRLNASLHSFTSSVLTRWEDVCRQRALTHPYIVLSDVDAASTELLNQAHGCAECVIAEVTSPTEIDRAIQNGFNGLVLKGNEAGGRVGELTSFVLLQEAVRRTKLPLWVYGGIGLHTAAACYAAGAGVVLDHQLLLTAEAEPPDALRVVVSRMDGSETVCQTQEDGSIRRAHARTAGNATDTDTWELGQDAAFAAPLAARCRTVGGVVEAVRTSIEEHIRASQRLRPLAAGSPMARSHGTRFPVVQGPMTRVSDTAAFARAVAEGGGLPFLALALMRAPDIERLLRETRVLLDSMPWGVGILGFVPDALRKEQLEVVRAIRPSYALIAGGRPDQAEGLERAGIRTYLHVPSPGLLRQFLETGARRFVFEGRECGGHVGPRSSFVLWNTMVDTAVEVLSAEQVGECHFLFAGGIHDSVSAAMVSATAAPLAERGAKIGALLGTAYLFTREAVESGAIVAGFQDEAVRCRDTVLLETGAGHATRCARTAYADEFLRQKQQATDLGPDELRRTLEDLNLGRLRIASKGIRRAAQGGGASYERVDDGEQHREGMYMIGQVAALRDSVCSIEELHRVVCDGGTERLQQVPEPHLSRASRPPSVERPCDIAIVGMACLLPKAPGLDAYWNNILQKVDAITEIPASRWDWKRYYDADPKAPDKIYSKWGGFLDDVPFDPLRYGMPPNTLPSIEPLQLLTLEVARAALEDAGYGSRPFARERCSVILGAGGGMSDLGNRYAVRSSLPGTMDGIPDQVYSDLPQWTEDSFAGILLNVAAGRVANRLDLGGMNCTLDAACASSLGALYVAARELESGASDMVLAGGADTMQNPFAYLCFSKTQALSPRGRCRTFDDTADGIVISEGIAIVVLKRLADAEADGDRIYAVLKGIGSSSDGLDKGLTAPRPEGQARSLRRAYRKAGFSPSTVGLIEAHGTGTAAGDRAEVEALTQVFADAGADSQGCAIGSVKSMVGHTKCTAGVAGLIKVALALHDKVLPPTLNVQVPNRRARFSESPFYVNSEARPWIPPRHDVPRRGGVSAFGFGGTNFHAVLEEYQNPTARPRYSPCEMFAWAADDKQALGAALAEAGRALKAGLEASLGELAFACWRKSSAVLGRNPAAHRLAISAVSLEDLTGKLTLAAELVSGGGVDSRPGIYWTNDPLAAEHKVAALFPGQGAQKPGMLAELAIRFPEVRRCFEIADCALAGVPPRRLSDLVFPKPGFTPEEARAREEALRDTRAAQPALGAAGVACWRLLKAFDIKPDCAAGHSYGEYVALWAAGAFAEEELYRLSEARGRMIAENSTPGTMAAVHESAERVEALVGTLPEVWLANRNAPRQTVLSGTRSGLEQALRLLEERGIHGEPLNVACAFHSPLVAAAQEGLEKIIRGTAVNGLAIPVYSNQTGEPYPADPDGTKGRLSVHLTRPVDFQGAIRAMHRDGVRIFVEAGPRPVLAGLVGQILSGEPHVAVCVGADLQNTLGQLFAHHVPVSLDRWFRGRSLRHVEWRETVASRRPGALWLVNGGRARPFGTPAVPPEPVKLQAQAPVAGPVSASAPHASPPSAVSSPQGEVEQVMLRYQDTMARMIDTHRQVMLAYLQGDTNTAISSPVLSIPVTREPERMKPAPPPQPPEPAPVAEPAKEEITTESLASCLLHLVSERTGYPPELLGLDQDMEAELGIDSIKRVEILGSFRKAVLPKCKDGMEKLASLKTLRRVIETVSAMRAPKPEEASPRVEPLPRYTVGLVETAPLSVPARLPEGPILITHDEGGIAEQLAQKISELGGTPVLIRRGDPAAAVGRSAIAGIVHLLPLRAATPFEELDAHGWRSRLDDDVISLFELVRDGAPRPGFLIACTRTREDACPSDGGVAGLVKSIADEWPDVHARVVDFSDETNAEIAGRLVAEIACSDSEPEVAYRHGIRHRTSLAAAPLDGRSEIEVAQGSVMLITGGARGITAEVAVDLARRYRPEMIVVGRTPVDAGELEQSNAYATAAELRSALMEAARAGGKVGRVADIEAQVTRILRMR